MHYIKNILIPIIFFGLIAVVFCSWHPRVNSYSVFGQIEALNGSVVNAKIRYTQKANDNNYAAMQEIDVKANGGFSHVLNLEARGPVYFYVIKEGYTVSRIVETLENQDKGNDIGTIPISTLHKKLSYQQRKDNSKVPFLALFSDKCLLKQDESINVTDILYFENLRSIQSASCSHSDNKQVLLSARLNFKGNTGNKIYFELAKQNDGTAYIQKPNFDADSRNNLLATKKE